MTRWATIRTVFARELRDQLRDRRTLFLVLVLPVLVYPLLGLGMLQILQFSRTPSSRVLIVGAPGLPDSPPLVVDGAFADGLLAESDAARVQVVSDAAVDARWQAVRAHPGEVESDRAARDGAWQRQLREELDRLACDAALLVPEGFGLGTSDPLWIVGESSRPASTIAAARARSAVAAWNGRRIVDSLQQHSIAWSSVQTADLSGGTLEGSPPRASTWSRVLPLILVIWALTGAFYPAVDVSAGEKERGTLETLLCSPVPRLDLVVGKLLTVATFSMATALLNLVSIALSGSFVLDAWSEQAGGLAAGRSSLPPLYVYPLLVLLLVPIAALCSAVAFAIAAFARSSKEGQYYLMPLLMLAFPLICIPMLPGVELNLGTALVPLAGWMLLMQRGASGDAGAIAAYAAPAIGMTLACTAFAVRWTVRHFADESILFRSAERIQWTRWRKRLRQGDAPTPRLAISAAVAILFLKFFSHWLLAAPDRWGAFAAQAIGTLLLVVLGPALLLAGLATRRPLQALGLQGAPWWTLPAAVLLAILLHPWFMSLSRLVMMVYPPGPGLAEAQAEMSRILRGAPGVWAVVLVVAIAPAVCEEIAFRGWILRGLARPGRLVGAVVASAAVFGFAHGILQQSLVTAAVGMVLGGLAIGCGSVWPCILFHATHNALTFAVTQVEGDRVDQSLLLRQIFVTHDGAVVGYQLAASVAFFAAAVWLVRLLIREYGARRWPQPCSAVTAAADRA